MVNTDKIEHVLPGSGYVDVSSYERVRIAFMSNVVVKVVIEWSYDGLTTGPFLIFRCSPCQWKSDLYDVIMPYLRVRILNESGVVTNDLVVHTWSPGRQDEKVVPEIAQRDVVSKSPFPKFLKSNNRSVDGRDARLPEFIPQGSLLVGGSNGKVVVLPKGNVGDILKVDEYGLAYKK